VVVVLGIVAGTLALTHGGGGNMTTGLMALQPPACTSATARAKPVAVPSSKTVVLGGHPLGVVVTPDGNYSFVTLGNAVDVLKNGAGASAPTPVAKIPAAGANDEAITPDGRYLLAAAGSGAYVISVADAEAGRPGAVLGTLATGGQGASQVSVSRDGRFAFVTLEHSAEMAVFNLQQSIARGYGRSGLVGTVPLGQSPNGIAQSPDGRWLYVTSFNQSLSAAPAQGKLYVLSMQRAETVPGQAVVASVAAGCRPMDVLVSRDGQDVWVTARLSNALLGFSAAKLQKNSPQSLIAKVTVGPTPNGLAFIDNGREIMVADSNLHVVDGMGSLALISTQQALRQKDAGALLRLIPAGATPREVAAEPGGKVLLATDNGSGQLQAINLGSLP
jgi:DNA-binding beta-propeller fold protein YncE